MKPYTVSVDIDLPREKVIALFDDVDNLYKWQDGLQAFEHLEGEPGQPGARSKMIFLNGGRELALFETITKRNLPDEFDGIYEWDGGRNSLTNRFVELDANRTRWESTCTYTFSSLMMKAMGFLMPSAFRKQNQKFLDNFKAFCEEGRDVRDE